MEDLNYQFVFDYAENMIIALAIFLLVGVEIWLINKGSVYLKNKVQKWNFQALKIQSFEFFNSGKQRLVITGSISFLQVTAIVLIIYFSLIWTLTIFPGTEAVANKLIEFIFLPVKSTFFTIVDYIPKLFTILVIVIIMRYVVKIVKTLAVEVGNKSLKIHGFEPRLARTTGSIIVFFINALMLILIFPYLPGYESIAFKGVAAFLGALVTIGGSSVIANYMAGIVITYMNSCQVGDWVQIENTTGEVTEISPFAIKIRTPKKVIVSIPNTKILSNHIHNYSRELGNHRALLHTTVSIGYDVPWDKVNQLLISAAKNTGDLDFSVTPFVRQIKLDDFYVVYELNAYAMDVRETPSTYSELHKHILEEFNEAGVEILSPHYRAQRYGSESTISSKADQGLPRKS